MQAKDIMQSPQEKATRIEEKATNNKKLTYSPPTIQVDVIEMENGIATSSATVQIGNEQNGYRPEVEDWQETVSEQQLFL